jgi:ABC-type transporter Mla subunit MlaD
MKTKQADHYIAVICTGQTDRFDNLNDAVAQAEAFAGSVKVVFTDGTEQYI